MKKQRLKFSKLTGVLLVLMATGMYVRSQTYTESQKVVRTFPAGSETRLDLSNKYGTVHIIPWNKDSVQINIDLFIKSLLATIVATKVSRL